LEGEFLQKAIFLLIKDEEGQKIGWVEAEYIFETCPGATGSKNQKSPIHYDYLYLFDHD